MNTIDLFAGEYSVPKGTKVLSRIVARVSDLKCHSGNQPRLVGAERAKNDRIPASGPFPAELFRAQGLDRIDGGSAARRHIAS